MRRHRRSRIIERATHPRRNHKRRNHNRHDWSKPSKHPRDDDHGRSGNRRRGHADGLLPPSGNRPCGQSSHCPYRCLCRSWVLSARRRVHLSSRTAWRTGPAGNGPKPSNPKGLTTASYRVFVPLRPVHARDRHKHNASDGNRFPAQTGIRTCRRLTNLALVSKSRLFTTSLPGCDALRGYSSAY